jgi:hypothetical protein
MQNLVQHWGWDVLAHPSYSPDIAPCDYWLLAHVKEYLWGKRFKLEMMPTSLSLPLYII